MRSLLYLAALAGTLFASNALAAKVSCQPVEKFKALTENTDAKPVFIAQSDNPDMTIVIVGDPHTGEWIAFALSKKLSNACNVANGFNFSIVSPKDEPKK